MRLTGEFTLTVVEGGLSPDSPASPSLTLVESAPETLEARVSRVLGEMESEVAAWEVLPLVRNVEARMGREFADEEVEAMVHSVSYIQGQYRELQRAMAGAAVLLPMKGDAEFFDADDSENLGRWVSRYEAENRLKTA